MTRGAGSPLNRRTFLKNYGSWEVLLAEVKDPCLMGSCNRNACKEIANSLNAIALEQRQESMEEHRQRQAGVTHGDKDPTWKVRASAKCYSPQISFCDQGHYSALA